MRALPMGKWNTIVKVNVRHDSIWFYQKVPHPFLQFIYVSGVPQRLNLSSRFLILVSGDICH